MHLGDHVHPVHHDRCGAGSAQGHVEHGAVLRHVDLLAPEHGVDAGAQAGLLGELEEERQGLVGDAMLRVVEIDPHRLRGEALAALRIAGEEILQMQVADLLVVALQFLPGPP